MLVDEENYLAHYGILRKSGRYPWGSGGSSESRSRDFLGMVKTLRDQGLSEVEIANGFGMTTTQLRNSNTIARNVQKQAQINAAQRLKDKGYSNVQIGKRMGLNESSVRALLAPGAKDKALVLQSTSDMLKEQVAQKKYIDIGLGVEHHIPGMTNNKLKSAVAKLESEGYTIHYLKIPQLGTGQNTSRKVLAAPGVKYSEVFRNRDQIALITDFTENGGRSFISIQTPISINSKRIGIRYAEDGGGDADGVLYIRPGVKDVSIGANRYAQVRVAVDGTHYLKGMAIYKDDLPEGIDILFNTNKRNTGNKHDAMKEQKTDKELPFGSIVHQIVDPKTGKVTSSMNLVGSKLGSGEEGSWSTWSRSLSSQFLSKQSPTLAKAQLDMTFERKKNELDSIMALTNPAVRSKLLMTFADDADSSAVHLKAAALPRQSNHVILPVLSMKPNEVYAPNFRDGERVVLIRHPHAGVFEIPELVVNNRNREAKKLLGTNPADAIGIHPSVARKLSGADFDGDTVLVIPNNAGRVEHAPSLEGLKDFDPVHAYPAYDGMRTMDGGTWNAKTNKVDYAPGKKPSSRLKQREMGDISNLITDMTIRGANNAELARAVRHSMVVIDAEKHALDWKASALDNGISQLKQRYQGRANAGASTLISKAGSELRIPEQTPRRAAKGGPIDKATGKKVFEPTGAQFVNRKGKVVLKTQRTTKLAVTEDAHTLSSGTRIEKIYADHSNKLKSLADQARLASVHTKNIPYSPSAKIAYSHEVESLNAKLNLALRNAPLERQAQSIANAVVHQKRMANPDIEASELKKIEAQALEVARIRTGAKKQRIEITESEWAAIQAGALAPSKLNKILNHANLDTVKKLATPKSEVLMTSIKKTRALQMLANGYSQADIADALGVSLSTLKRSIGGDGSNG